MFNFRKAHKMEIIEEGSQKQYGIKNVKGKNDQEYYGKVTRFLGYCMNFKNKLNSLKSDSKIIVSKTTIMNNTITAKSIKGCFNESFKEYFVKSKKFSLLSRTTRVLKEMDKKLEKLGEMELTSKGAVEKIRDAFEYKREGPNGAYIKRSTIDDKAIYGFFNGTLLEIIKKLAEDVKAEENAQQEANDKQEAKEKIEFIEESLDYGKFENKFVVLESKIKEITDDLNAVKKEKNEYGEDEEVEKAFKRNYKFIEKLTKNVEEIDIKSLEEKFGEAKKELKKYRENVDRSKASKSSELKLKQNIRKIKNDVDKCGEKLKKLKRETEKAVKEFNTIKSKLEKNEKFLASCLKLDGGYLTITGNQGVKILARNYLNCRQKLSRASVIIMENVNNIGCFFGVDGGIFSDFKNLTSVCAENLSGTIGNHAFNGCTLLASFNEGNGYDYNIPANVTKIEEFAFYFAGSEVTNGFLANAVGVKTIGRYAFYGSGLKEIKLPNVTDIGREAFNNCSKLGKVFLGSNINVDRIDSSAFGSSGSVTVFVPTEELRGKLDNKVNVNVKVEEKQ